MNAMPYAVTGDPSAVQPTRAVLAGEYLDWLERVALLPYPDDEAALAVLRLARAAKPATFLEFKLWCLWLSAAYGTWGHSIRPSELTMSEDTGRSRRTVGRWLAVAVALGIFERVKEATRAAPAEYRIGPLTAPLTATGHHDGPPF